MATYTTRLMTLVDGYSQTKPNLSIREKIEMARPKIFDFDYPFFDKGLKAEFERHFIRKFYMREIGFETEGLFKFQLETWLQIHMPYFNKLLESETIEFNPLENVNVKLTSNLKNNKDQNDTIDRIEDEKMKETEKKERDTVGKQTSHNETKSTSKTVGEEQSETDRTAQTIQDDFNRKLDSDTPQSRLSITSNDGQGVIEYASNIEENNANNKENQTGNEASSGTSESTTTASGSLDTTLNTSENMDETGSTDQTKNKVGNQKLDSAIQVLEDYAKHEIGKTGGMTYSKMLTEYRSTFLRIEQDIFEEMQELFMMVY